MPHIVFELNAIEISECQYRGKKCDKSDFKTVFTRYGKCYTFNNPDNKTQIKDTLKGGVDNGLALLFDIQQEEYMPMWKESGTLKIITFYIKFYISSKKRLHILNIS